MGTLELTAEECNYVFANTRLLARFCKALGRTKLASIEPGGLRISPEVRA